MEEVTKQGWVIFFVVISNAVDSSWDFAPVGLAIHGNFEIMSKDLELLGGLKEATQELFEIIHVVFVQLIGAD
eukprot:10310737-Ditylum_brightwellii.AAC.1